MARDFYAILGVAQNATAKQIRERFLLVARERHPDRFHGEEKAAAETEFQQVTEAFNTLFDPDRRRQHDMELASMVQAGPAASQEEIAKVYIQRGLKALRDGKLRLAVENLERATEECPTDAQAWYQLAAALSRDRRALPRARAAIVKACDLQPMEPNFLRLAGRLFADSGMQAKAIDYYQRALDWGGPDADIEEALQKLRRSGRGGLFG